MVRVRSHRGEARHVLFAVAAIMLVREPTAYAANVTTAKRPLLPADAIQTVRFMDDPPALSPDGKTFVARLVHGDVARNGVWLELVSGGLGSLDEAGHLATVARLFGPGLGDNDSLIGPDVDTNARANPLRWIDDDRVAFLWSDAKNVRQVVSVNVRDGAVEFLTHSPSQVADFDVGPSGTVLYNAMLKRTPERSEELLQTGFSIADNTDGMAVLSGVFDGGSFLDSFWNSTWFVAQERRAPRRIALADRVVDPMLPYGRTLAVSATGRSAIVSGPPGRIPSDWDRYTDPFLRRVIALIRTGQLNDPDGAPQDDVARRAIQLYVVDLEQGTSHALWNAMAGIGLSRSAAWSPDEKAVLLAPTFLPVSAHDERGLAGTAAAVVDVRTSEYATLPINLAGVCVKSLSWIDRETIAIETVANGSLQHSRSIFRRQNGVWTKKTVKEVLPHDEGRIRLEIRQDLNTPPKLYALDTRRNRQRELLDPNPRLKQQFQLGHVEKIEGSLKTGEHWAALVFYPPQHHAGVRYPLVIQASGSETDLREFTLYGWQGGAGLGPTQIAVYAAQSLAGLNIVVAQVSASVSSGTQEGRIRTSVFESVIEKLVSSGLVDRSRVGLSGFSRPGFHVEYTLTHSSFPFAAAITADNFDPSYMQAALTGWNSAAAYTNGAAPFGRGLQEWLAEAPGFNADRVHAPLLLFAQSFGVPAGILSNWELFSRLRHLRRPVEYYVMPELSEHGSHSPQNPKQVLAIQQRAVDWFDFWLNADDELTAQYPQWRRLRK